MVVVVVVLSFLDRAPCRYRRSTGVQYQTQWHVHGTNRRRECRHVNGTRPQRHVIISREFPLPLLFCLRMCRCCCGRLLESLFFVFCIVYVVNAFVQFT